MRWLAAVALLAASPAAGQVAEGQGALLRGLDKLDGRVADIGLAVGDTAEFGRLRITLGACRYPRRNPAGNAYAWLTVEQDADALFSGWMVASSPALNALDHPRYDIWVIACET